MKAPLHLWIVGGLSLIWNSGGAYDYVMTKAENANYLAMLTPEQLGFLDGAPVWFNVAWAVGVWFSVIGSLLLLVRSRYAGSAFFFSLVGLIVASVYTYLISDTGDALAMSGTAALIFSIAIPIILVGLWVYARAMTAKGVLR